MEGHFEDYCTIDRDLMPAILENDISLPILPKFMETTQSRLEGSNLSFQDVVNSTSVNIDDTVVVENTTVTLTDGEVNGAETIKDITKNRKRGRGFTSKPRKGKTLRIDETMESLPEISYYTRIRRGLE